MTENDSPTFVGQSLLRREDQYLLRGEGMYLDDIPEPQGTLHLAFVLSPHAHARIISVDASEALQVPGVVAVLTADDFAGLVKPMHTDIEMPTYKYTDREVIARDLVRFVGEHVAVVVAENNYAAHDGIELVQVDYEILPAAASLEQAILPDAPRVHEHIERNIIFSGQFATPDFAGIHESGEFSLRERFRHGRVAGVPMEPRGCLAIPDRGDSINLYTSTQIPHIVRTELAKHLDRSEACIRVIVPEVGGGFGTKAQVYPEEMIVAALCFKHRRPIKWVQDRREELLTNTHARDHIYEVEIAFTKEGVVTSLQLQLFTNIGAYSSSPFGGTLETTGGARMIVGPYKIRNYAYECHAVTTHTCPSGVYRGVAQPACFMAIEGLMDRIGRTLGIDPLEIRLRNVVTPADMPWVNVMGVRYDTGSYQECLQRARIYSDYDSVRRAQPANRLVDGKYRGIGISNMTEVTGTGAPGWRVRGLRSVSGVDSATIRVEPTGRITVYVSHASAGQGHLTTFAQVAADHLGATLACIRIVEGDTGSTPYGSATFASRSAVTGGGAIIRAAKKLTDKMRRIAGSLLEVNPDEVVFKDGMAHVISDPRRRISFQTIAETAYSTGGGALPPGEEFGLEACDYYDPPMVTVANAVHIVSVTVDARDGRVAIENYCVVHDCGKLINPMIVDGQIHGGIAQGIGEVLMEEMLYDENGQLICASLLDYLLPTAMDIPNLSLHHIESPSIDSVGGFKGVGEGGLIGAVPALTNAIADALSGIGANVNSVPLRPSYLLSLIRNAALKKPDQRMTETTVTENSVATEN
jgi:carbon-monoxide dehydrogenase large subunit